MKWVAAIIIRTKAHRKDSETYGGRQNQKIIDIHGEVMKRSIRDGKDLRAAVDSNWNALSRRLVEKYGLPESEIEPMRARIHELNEAQGWYK